MPQHLAERWRRAGGFTLLEVMITLVVLVLAAAVVVPAVSKVSVAELRSTAGKLAGSIRAAYDSAALGGRSYRMAFDVGKQLIRVETDASTVASAGGLRGIAELLRSGGVQPPGVDSTAPKVEVQPPAQILALFGGGADEDDEGSAGLARFAAAGHELAMPAGVRIMDVWIEGMSQPASDGLVYLQFFPNGYTESALVHLSDEDGTVFTVKVTGVTGATEIVGSYVEVPR